MRQHAIDIFKAAVQAVQPQYLLPKHIQCGPELLQLGDQQFLRSKLNHIYIIGAGKAAAAMARETELILGENITEGIVVTKYEHALPLRYTRCLEAGHPIPDAAGVEAGEAITSLLKKAGENDLVIALISGGASALMVDCPPGVSLHELQQVFSQLLDCGADIVEMNIVRKHLSPGIKGGQLIRTASPARLISFILSDVPGDRLESIASGPTVPDSTTFKDACEVMEKYNLMESVPVSIKNYLQDGLRGNIPDTPKPGDKIFENSYNFLIGTNQIALQAAKLKAEALGYTASILSEALSGEARLKAIEVVKWASEYKGPRPACLLMGGETTVTIKGNGIGGRNQEFVLAALVALKNNSDVPVILSAGTDGTDGPTPAAGAVIDESTMDATIDPKPYLSNNDSYHFFQQAGGHIITGPTQTNVMDVVVVLIG